MPPLSSGDLQELERTAEEIQAKDTLDQRTVTRLADKWRSRLSSVSDEEELFDLVDATGEPTGVTAPRWLCHLLGFRHRAVHIILRSPQNLLVLQVRSPDKADWPDHIDTSVGGHVRAGQGFLEAGIIEMAQELGLPPEGLSNWLVDGSLEPVGEPFQRYDHHPGDPPFRNRQVNRLYAGQLTPSGLAAIRFKDGEVSALYVCTNTEAERLLAVGERVAPGLGHLLSGYLDWHRGRRPELS